MKENILIRLEKFDQYDDVVDIAENIASISINLANVAMGMASVERVPRYIPEKRENDAEHSFMLALVATEIASQFFPNLNVGYVTWFSIVHELTELILKDKQTFAISEAELEAKKQSEENVLEQLCAQLPMKTAEMLRLYEQQEMPEARLVSFIDKHLPVLVDILGPGSQVMHEDYNVQTLEDLQLAHLGLAQRFKKRFPEPELEILHLARNGLATQFERVFKVQPYLQEALF
jgi:5'-deoxynucleotidase YfbR-like HD superfamily hydrolase